MQEDVPRHGGFFLILHPLLTRRCDKEDRLPPIARGVNPPVGHFDGLDGRRFILPGLRFTFAALLGFPPALTFGWLDGSSHSKARRRECEVSINNGLKSCGQTTER